MHLELQVTRCCYCWCFPFVNILFILPSKENSNCLKVHGQSNPKQCVEFRTEALGEKLEKEMPYIEKVCVSHFCDLINWLVDI